MEGPLCPSLPALRPVKETLGSSKQAYVIALQGCFEPAIYTPTANSGTCHSKLKSWHCLVLYSTMEAFIIEETALVLGSKRYRRDFGRKRQG